jgi:hypothetical protein
MSADNEKTDNNLENLLRQLAEARKLYEQSQYHCQEMETQLYASPAFQFEAHLHEEAQAQSKQSADAIKALALAEYERTGLKTINEAVKVRIVSDDHLHYDPITARTWALNQAPALVVLDKKAFEKYAHQVADGPMALDFVGVEDISYPQATIASDLSKWLPKAEEISIDELPF